jgi:predicted transcriptional regulator
MRTTTQPPQLRLRREQFLRRCKAESLTTEAAIARYTGLSQATIMRLLAGRIAPGETTIAHVLRAFPTLHFEDVFEVTEGERAA